MEEKARKIKEQFSSHKKASKIIFIGSALIVFLIALSIVTSILLVIFPVEDIEVVGNSRYSYSEIIEASGIKKGARLYYVNENKAMQRVLSSKPYLESVTVHSYFPNRVKIEIKEFEHIYLVKHERGYAYVNGDFEILEIVEASPEFEKFSGIFIKLENVISGEIGDIYSGEDSKRASDLIEELRENGFYEYLNIIDVENKYSVSFIISKRYKFVIGAMTDIAEKIDASFKVCFSDSFKREENCIIDASDKKRVILRYISDEIIREEFDFCEK